MPPEELDKRRLIESLCCQLNEVIDASSATPGLKTIAAIITAARYARSTSMPAFGAASMIRTYIVRGDPF